jgi:hypothetical protein
MLMCIICGDLSPDLWLGKCQECWNDIGRKLEDD